MKCYGRQTIVRAHNNDWINKIIILDLHKVHNVQSTYSIPTYVTFTYRFSCKWVNYELDCNAFVEFEFYFWIKRTKYETFFELLDKIYALIKIMIRNSCKSHENFIISQKVGFL